MADKTFTCQVVTPRGQALRREVVSVALPGRDGRIGILANHAPMVGFIGKGDVSFREADGRDYLLEIAGGFWDVRDNLLTLLADQAGQPIEHKTRKPAPHPD